MKVTDIYRQQGGDPYIYIRTENKDTDIKVPFRDVQFVNLDKRYPYHCKCVSIKGVEIEEDKDITEDVYRRLVKNYE